MSKNDSKERVKKCNQEIQASLKKYSCGLKGVPVVKIENGNIKVDCRIELIHVIKPDKSNKYMN
jgi:hypothetical protein